MRQSIVFDNIKEIIGSNWLGRVMAYLARATTVETARLQKIGVQALVFGKASVRKRGQRYEPRSELDGIQLQVKLGPKEQQHNGTQLFPNDRVATFGGGEAIVLFIDDFSVIRLRENSELLIAKRTPGTARRKTLPARLERGALKSRLGELDGR